MVGDEDDMAGRMQAVLPAGWFPDIAPVLSWVLSGFGSVWSAVFALYSWALTQIRIATATGAMLDLCAWDFFGATLYRRPGEADASLLGRIDANLFAPKATRLAVTDALVNLVGITPTIFEPAYSFDTGGYSDAGENQGAAYGLAGGYGAVDLPFQFFLVAYRGAITPVANVVGYYYGSGWAGGGYDSGAIEYVDASQFAGQITDADLEAAVAAVLPCASIAWMAIEDSYPWIQAPGPVTDLVAA